MSELLEFIQTHEEAFRSRTRLASLYSDFRHQRSTNPDGYQANASAWLRALTNATKAGLVPAQSVSGNDRLILHTEEELLRALQTQENGQPLALGAVLEDAVKKKDLIQLREFLDAKQSVYARSWIPTPWQILNWSLRQIGIGDRGTTGDRVEKADFIIMANVENAAKTILNQVSKTSTSNVSRIYSRELFNTTFSSSLGVDAISQDDLSVLLTHLSRDRAEIAYAAQSGVIKFKAANEAHPSPITAEDVSIASLRSLMASLEPQIQQLTVRVSELDRKAREAVANKQTIAAKSALRQKKLADTKLQQRTATLAQLEDVYAKIEQAADQVEIVKVMEASSQTLKSLNKQTGGVEKVQDVMDGLREERMNADEIGQAINDVSAGEIDEGEVEDELEALERVERGKQQEAERREREKKEADETEKTRQRFAELDALGEQKSSSISEGQGQKEKIPEPPQPVS